MGTIESNSSYRYALKQLSPTIVRKASSKSRLVHAFAGAATDLAIEAQLLLTMDHPNIIRIRGFAKSGPYGYRKGCLNGYFLILDLLPETLETRVLQWRRQYKKNSTINTNMESITSKE